MLNKKYNLSHDSDSNSNSDSDSDNSVVEEVVIKKPKKVNKKKIIISSEDEKIISTKGNTEKVNKICDEIWSHIFKEINYDGEKERIITADEIKNAGKTWNGKKHQFEPRLLCKQDTSEDRPSIFKDKKLNILSIKNGEYIITKENIYVDLEYPPNIEEIIIEKNSDSVLLSFGDSETSMIDNLRYSGIFEGDLYLKQKIKYGSLLSGRHRCSFETLLGKSKISISGSQFETDGCYESNNKVLLIECKSKIMKNFNVRQLYYPYRYIFDKMEKNNKKKTIIPIFICSDKKMIHIWKYEFENPLEMMSIKLVSYNKFMMVDKK
jgi:hypothetical protein